MVIWFKSLKEKLNEFNIYGFDTETIGQNNNFYLGTVFGNDIQKIFYNQLEMINFLNSHIFKHNTFICATNLQFDILSLFKNNMNMIQPLFRNSEMITAIMKDKNDRRTKFIDTYNFVPYSVEKLGKILNIPKMKKPERLGQIPQTKEEINYLALYCMRDSEISCKFLQFLQQGYNKELNTNLKLTVGSNSMNLFRNNYLKIPIRQPERKLLETFYKGYYGGRTEVFKRGHIEKCYYYDINSLYPTVMLNDYPNPNTQNINKSNKNIIKEYDGISEIRINIPKEYTFLLPFKQKQKIGTKLIFPIGTIKGWFTHAEIRKAIEYNGKIISYGKSIYYNQNFKPFEEYVNILYSKRLKLKEQNNPMEILYKLSLNSLYGKFAQKINNKQEIIHADNMTSKKLDEIAKKQLDCHMIGDYFYITNKKGIGEKIPSFVNPIFSIYTTAYARLLMFEKMQDIQDYYYMDTDSLIINKKINVSLKLGDFKKEYDIKEGKIIKPKMYGFIGNKYENDKLINKDISIIRCKGLPLRDNYEEFLNFLKTKKAQYFKFAKFKECIRSKENNKYGKKQFNQIITILKNYDLEDTKRIWKNKSFDSNILEDSKPINIRFNPLINNEKKLYNITEKKNTNTFINQLKKKLYNIDTFDGKGKDISNKNFLDNEIFWTLQE